MKNIFLLSFAALLIAVGCNSCNSAPPHAASSQTWTFGDQTWSDAIWIPACNKSDFKESQTSPDCRSYTSGSSSSYYYNWPYVHANAKVLCPAPWRVPNESDYDYLLSVASPQALVAAWGTQGFATSGSRGDVYVNGTDSYIWTSQGYTNNKARALYISRRRTELEHETRDSGFTVRCVR
jgi:uncharacterized protein (TIGR02145 family)